MAKSSAPMNITQFLAVAQLLPPDVSILIRADHGVGKSQIAKTLKTLRDRREGIAREFIDQRLSQKTEGDMIGLPDKKTVGGKEVTDVDGISKQVTVFLPPDWVQTACSEPTMLLLDEFNRATPEVMQAGFELVLDRRLNGNHLHPDTLVIACVNTGFNYSVNDMDPALLDRFWVVDLVPSVEDWLFWATTDDAAFRKDPERPNIEPIVVDFIRAEQKWLDTPSDLDPGSVSTSRRSWERFSNAGRYAGFFSGGAGQNLYTLAQGFLGTECAMRFNDFAKSWSRNITGDMIVNDLDDHKELFARVMKEGNTSDKNALVERVSGYLGRVPTTLNDKQLANVSNFMKSLPAEIQVAFWNQVVAHGVKKIDLVTKFSQHCRSIFIAALGQAADKANETPLTEKNLSPVPEAPAKKTRAKKAK